MGWEGPAGPELNNLNRPGQAANKIILKFAYKTSNYEKVMYAISV